ncbi:hypothetical protein ABZ816_35200 [Actinosynnema sp. NPDC047251]|uniref:Uncharacterized protein n=1 Tax=Saccharothrix espanaensis (strain ATCC 51144 / DSM 44229 / JCM 9112 / NBRC 15066 / NRRL 15764) TaxID=1179773 RepID=K0JWJ3_SACES|nr:hypothetical protein [Saccharothrix espanaensis]CCH28548.1 hypothetical protein BN6_12220 [Saccharothrix espanaensis DSM 44229]
MTTTTYETETRIGPTTYRLRAFADPDLFVEVSGTDTSGLLVAEGNLRLPAGAGSSVGKLLGQVLDALGKLGAPPPRGGRHRPANANQPWTDELDEDLRDTWLAASPGAPAADLIRAIAKQQERSPASIRSRLARVGCDPDIAGRPLSPEAAHLLGVQGRDQGEVRATPDSTGVVGG